MTTVTGTDKATPMVKAAEVAVSGAADAATKAVADALNATATPVNLAEPPKATEAKITPVVTEKAPDTVVTEEAKTLTASASVIESSGAKAAKAEAYVCHACDAWRGGLKLQWQPRSTTDIDGMIREYIGAHVPVTTCARANSDQLLIGRGCMYGLASRVIVHTNAYHGYTTSALSNRWFNNFSTQLPVEQVEFSPILTAMQAEQTDALKGFNAISGILRSRGDMLSGIGLVTFFKYLGSMANADRVSTAVPELVKGLMMLYACSLPPDTGGVRLACLPPGSRLFLGSHFYPNGPNPSERPPAIEAAFISGATLAKWLTGRIVFGHRGPANVVTVRGTAAYPAPVVQPVPANDAGQGDNVEGEDGENVEGEEGVPADQEPQQEAVQEPVQPVVNIPPGAEILVEDPTWDPKYLGVSIILVAVTPEDLANVDSLFWRVTMYDEYPVRTVFRSGQCMGVNGQALAVQGNVDALTTYAIAHGGDATYNMSWVPLASLHHVPGANRYSEVPHAPLNNGHTRKVLFFLNSVADEQGQEGIGFNGMGLNGAPVAVVVPFNDYRVETDHRTVALRRTTDFGLVYNYYFRQADNADVETYFGSEHVRSSMFDAINVAKGLYGSENDFDLARKYVETVCSAVMPFDAWGVPPRADNPIGENPVVSGFQEFDSAAFEYCVGPQNLQITPWSAEWSPWFYARMVNGAGQRPCSIYAYDVHPAVGIHATVLADRFSASLPLSDAKVHALQSLGLVTRATATARASANSYIDIVISMIANGRRVCRLNQAWFLQRGVTLDDIYRVYVAGEIEGEAQRIRIRQRPMGIWGRLGGVTPAGYTPYSLIVGRTLFDKKIKVFHSCNGEMLQWQAAENATSRALGVRMGRTVYTYMQDWECAGQGWGNTLITHDLFEWDAVANAPGRTRVYCPITERNIYVSAVPRSDKIESFSFIRGLSGIMYSNLAQHIAMFMANSYDRSIFWTVPLAYPTFGLEALWYEGSGSVDLLQRHAVGHGVITRVSGLPMATYDVAKDQQLMLGTMTTVLPGAQKSISVRPIRFNADILGVVDIDDIPDLLHIGMEQAGDFLC